MSLLLSSGSVGLEEPLSRLVANSLLKVEADHATASDWDDANIHPSSKSWWKLGFGKKEGANGEEEGGLRWSKDIGVTGFLMRFGEGLGKSSFDPTRASIQTLRFSNPSWSADSCSLHG